MKSKVVHIKLELRTYQESEDITAYVEQAILEKLQNNNNSIEIISVCPYNIDVLKQVINTMVVYRDLD